MEVLSIALVLIFVMWLIDKHDAWKGTAKIVLVVCVLVVLGFCGVYGWGRYENWRATKAETAEKAKRDAAVKACIERNYGKDILDQVACENDPNLQPTVNQPANVPIDLSAGFVPKTVAGQQVVHAQGGYIVDQSVCWKDKQGKLHYRQIVVRDGIVLDMSTAQSLDGKSLIDGCPALKPGEALTWPKH